ncbi:dehydrodolichyl diphosphate synthase complex subunit nus1-like [Babylonia areolata]|uniref:dehydrodolichyl diphosphate synthase complex subunit nus1-like n=1 Tax=Babylonia areolata TaxID=304850 RepID=UPI003FD40775
MFRILILRLIHYVLALGEFTFGIFKLFPQYKSIFAPKQHASKVEADAKKLSKLPLHIGMVVVENDFSIKDLANMIVWSVTMGISHISVYDMNGEMKRHSGGLQGALEQSKEGIMGGEEDPHEIQIFTHSLHFTEKLAVGRGTKKAEVHLLSAEDGCQSIVQVARNLSHRVLAQGISASDISPAFVTDVIHETHPFPDPDLILKFGSTHCLMGYLPWQTRLTEIISIPSHKGLAYQDFYSSLQTYANTQQRFGK